MKICDKCKREVSVNIYYVGSYHQKDVSGSFRGSFRQFSEAM